MKSQTIDRAKPDIDVVVFGKHDCHLCEMVEAEIRAKPSLADRVRVVDIDGDRFLHDRYFLRVPVVTVRGREVFEAKMMDREGRWKAQLASLLAES